MGLTPTKGEEDHVEALDDPEAGDGQRYTRGDEGQGSDGGGLRQGEVHVQGKDKAASLGAHDGSALLHQRQG